VACSFQSHCSRWISNLENGILQLQSCQSRGKQTFPNTYWPQKHNHWHPLRGRRMGCHGSVSMMGRSSNLWLTWTGKESEGSIGKTAWRHNNTIRKCKSHVFTLQRKISNLRRCRSYEHRSNKQYHGMFFQWCLDQRVEMNEALCVSSPSEGYVQVVNCPLWIFSQSKH
jgi:hypothetical protein